MQSDLRDSTFSEYLKLAKELKSYEKQKLRDWYDMAIPLLETATSKMILKLTAVHDDKLIEKAKIPLISSQEKDGSTQSLVPGKSSVGKGLSNNLNFESLIIKLYCSK